MRSSRIANANIPRNRAQRADAPARASASRTTSVSELVAKRTPCACELGPQLAVVVELAVVGERQPVLGERLVGRRRQVDDREAAVAERAPRARAVDDLADAARRPGPRWAIRSTIVRTSCSPSGCWKAPAIPHMVRPASAAPTRRRVERPAPADTRRGARAGRAGRRPAGTPRAGAPRPARPRRARGRSRPWPAQLAVVVQQADDGLRVAVDAVRLDVDRGVAGRDPGLPAGRRRRPAGRRPCTPCVLFIVDTSLSGFIGSGRQPEVRGGEHVGDDARPAPGPGARRGPAGRAGRAAATRSSWQSPAPMSVNEMSSRPSSWTIVVGGRGRARSTPSCGPITPR